MNQEKGDRKETERKKGGKKKKSFVGTHGSINLDAISCFWWSRVVCDMEVFAQVDTKVHIS